jgi:hypothetical protein
VRALAVDAPPEVRAAAASLVCLGAGHTPVIDALGA